MYFSNRCNFICSTGTILLWCWCWQSFWAWHCWCPLQGLPLCRHQHQRYQRRSDARTSKIANSVYNIWSHHFLLFIIYYFFESYVSAKFCCIFYNTVGISSWSCSWHFCWRRVVGCSLHFGGSLTFSISHLFYN